MPTLGPLLRRRGCVRVRVRDGVRVRVRVRARVRARVGVRARVRAGDGVRVRVRVNRTSLELARRQSVPSSPKP